MTKIKELVQCSTELNSTNTRKELDKQDMASDAKLGRISSANECYPENRSDSFNARHKRRPQAAREL